MKKTIKFRGPEQQALKARLVRSQFRWDMKDIPWPTKVFIKITAEGIQRVLKNLMKAK